MRITAVTEGVPQVPASTRRVTQQDIARMTGVSQATVSLVLNERDDAAVRIAPETRERVLQAIRFEADAPEVALVLAVDPPRCYPLAHVVDVERDGSRDGHDAGRPGRPGTDHAVGDGGVGVLDEDPEPGGLDRAAAAGGDPAVAAFEEPRVEVFFELLGFRPGRVFAAIAVLTEIVAGLLITLPRKTFGDPAPDWRAQVRSLGRRPVMIGAMALFALLMTAVAGGLGLALTKNLVETMGGTIGVDTGPDGSTFRIAVPRAR